MTNTGCLVAIRAMGPGYHRKTKIAQTEVATQTVTKRPTFAGAFERLGSIGAKRIAPLAHVLALRLGGSVHRKRKCRSPRLHRIRYSGQFSKLAA